MPHHPAIEFSRKPDTRSRVFRYGFQQGVDLIQSTVRCAYVALRDFDDVIDYANEVLFEERMPDEAHQFLAAIAARCARAPAVTRDAFPTGSH